MEHFEEQITQEDINRAKKFNKEIWFELYKSALIGLCHKIELDRSSPLYEDRILKVCEAAKDTANAASRHNYHLE